MGGSHPALVVESGAATTFVVLAIVGFKYSLWLVVAALAPHGALDVVHGQVIANPGVPAWWPPFCLTYDVGQPLIRPASCCGGSLEPIQPSCCPLSGDRLVDAENTPRAPAAGTGRRGVLV